MYSRRGSVLTAKARSICGISYSVLSADPDAAGYAGLILGGVMCGLSAAVVVGYRNRARRDRRLVERGTAVDGVIVGRLTITHRSNKTDTVTYSFTTSGGNCRQGTKSVDPWAFDAVKKNMPVTVLYDPQNPAHSTVYETADYEVAPTCLG